MSDIQAAKIAYDAAMQNAKTAEQAFEQCAPQAARDLADPTNTSSSADCDVTRAAREMREANYQAYRALLKLRMTEAGAKAEEVEEWLSSHGRDAWKKAEKIRKSQAVLKAEKSVGRGIAWTLAKAMLIFLAIGGFLHYKYGPEEPWHTTPANVGVKIIPVEPMTIPSDQFNMFIGGLSVPFAPSAPAPVIPPPQIAQAAREPDIPAAAAPEPVAALEAEPVTVEVETPTGERTIQTTVGQVYQAAPPQIRQQMEAPPPPQIEHDYNTEDPNSCFVRHCLSPHKDFNVNADFDTGGVQTAHVHY